MSNQNQPCPFCGSSDLQQIDITRCDDDGDLEIEEVECLSCGASAPVAKWNQRAVYMPIVTAASSTIGQCDDCGVVDHHLLKGFCPQCAEQQ